MSEVKLLKTNTVVMGLFSGSAFGLFMGFFLGLSTTSFSSGFNFGLGLGIFFGLAIAIFSHFVGLKNKVIPEDIANEGVVAHGPANHFKGPEGRGGWLYLTRQNMIFKPHNMNIQNEALRISLNDIRKYGERSTLGIVPNGIFIELPSGRTEKFVIGQRGEWIELLYKLIGKGTESNKVSL